jgi:uncharacterized protein YndB with AHSA1/START domain
MFTKPTEQSFTKTVHINAPTSTVWQALTTPELMQKWMSENELHIVTDWQIGHPMIIRSKLHGARFENKGTVLQFEPEQVLEYSHLSSASRLPDLPESYSTLEFRLTPAQGGTSLAFTTRNFPTETIYKHMAFYWNVTLEILKKKLEEKE